ncbi:MAG: tetratricopeptide repeat protein [bacterium]|nr:tetratricopeptide repeat protein [bacterium]
MIRLFVAIPLLFQLFPVLSYAVNGPVFDRGDSSSLEAEGDLAAAGWVAMVLEGDEDRAVNLFERALDLDEKDYDAVEGLGWLRLQRGELAEAQDLWMRYVAGRPGTAAAECFARNGRLFDGADEGFAEWPLFLLLASERGGDPAFADRCGVEALTYLAHTGQREKVEALEKSLGYLTDFEVAGVYSRFGELDILEQFELDEKPRIEKLKPAFGERRFVGTPPGATFVDFEAILDEYSGVAYARKAFVWPGGEAILEVESDDYFVVSLNGEEVITHFPDDEIAQYIHRVRLDIPAGPALLLVKNKANYTEVYSTDNVWGCRVRLLDGSYSTPELGASEVKAKWGGRPWVLPVVEEVREHFIDYFYKSILAANDGCYEAAAEYVEYATAAAPDCALFHLIAAYVRILSGSGFDLATGKSQLRMAIASDEKAVLAVEELGVFASVEGKRDEAIDYFRRALDMKPDYISAMCGLAEMAYGQGWDPEMQRQAKAALELNPRSPRALATLGDYAYDNDDIAGAVEYYTRYEKVKADDAINLARLAECHTLLGDNDAARRYYSKILAVDPYSLDGYLGLAAIALREADKDTAITFLDGILTVRPRAADTTEQYGMLLVETGRTEEGYAALRRSLELNPSDFELRDYLLRKGIVAEDAVDRVLRPDVAKLLEERTPQDELTDCNSALVLQQTVYYLYSDYSFAETNHYLIQIINANGEADWAEITFLDDPGTKILEARTHTPDGDILDAYSIKSNNGWNIISMEGVKPGSVLEVAYELNLGRRMVFDMHHFYTRQMFLQRINDRVDKGRVALVVPNDFPKDKYPTGFLINGRGGPKKVKGDGRTAYIFENTDAEPIIPEDYMPANAAFMPYAMFTTFHEPDDVAQWFAGELWGRIRCDRTMRTQLDRIIEGAEDDRDRAARVYQYVMENVASSGGSIFYPADSRAVYFDRSGRPVDRAILMMAFYRELEIEAELAILDASGDVEDLDIVTPEIFDSVLVYLPGIGAGGTYLDPFLEGLAFGDYWNSNYGRKAIFISDDGYRMGEIPAKPFEEDSIYLALDAELIEDGSATFAGRREYRGLRGTYRQLFRDPEGRDNTVEYALSNLFDAATLDEYDTENLDDSEGTFAITFVGSAPSQARTREGKLILGAVLYPYNLSDLYTSSPTRRYPLSIDRNEGIIDIVSYKLPEGYRVEEIPKSFSLKTPEAMYEVDYTVDEGEIEIERRLFIEQAVVEVKDYEKFADFCARVDRFEKKEIILEPFGK